ncbi:Disease resistance protein RPM1 [Camellia lanceoleosa]|uniref:Disease resistance protein RPM1 n=1 Tax=Camellia lanceoleosa TaxID=1840588 RepID=A0ACC0IRC7_9ERIC|nr:Disease resistance protein RPM1 [Camellia lanceoleosa]
MALAAVGLLIGRIVSALESEASLIGGVRDELNQLKLEFASMRSFLEDADKTTVQTEGEKTWVANVRDLAYEVEDIIDEYMYYMNRQKVHGKFKRFLRQIVYAPKNLWVRHRIATKLQKINRMIKSITERNRRYGVDRVGEASPSSQDHQRRLRNLGESSLFFKDDDLVGIEDGKEQLLDWLTDKEESQRTVISVVGMGGSGKTTLVAQAYNSQIVKRKFDCYAWITVSQTYVVDDLLRSMIKEFYRGVKEAIPMDLSNLSYRELIEMITNFLRLKRYVIVFDDVWSSNLWRDIHVSLLDEGLGKIKKFCVVYDGREANDEEESATNRRMSIQSIGRELQSWNWKGMLKLRSLLVFVVEEIALPLGLRLLRVLDLEDAPIEVLPEELVDLFNLRYLNLKGTRVKELPKSIGRLCNLNTLDITNSKIEVLPAGITELQNLRHLMMIHFDFGILDDFHLYRGTTTPSNICKLKNLQVLAGVEAQADLMKRIKNMTQLKRIGITKVREVDEEDLCTAIQNMSLLRRLSVKVIDEDEYLRMDALSSTPPRYLKKLILVGKLEKVPCWFHSLQNLTFLSLRWSRLAEDPIPYIQALPNLGRLYLCNAYEGGGQLCFSEGFHKLRILSLWNFPQLNEIIIERGVMPGLQEIFIRKCMQLKILPHGIEYLEDLQELSLTFVTNELIECIRGEGSKDHQKVRHIPRIYQGRQTPVGLKYQGRQTPVRISRSTGF